MLIRRVVCATLVAGLVAACGSGSSSGAMTVGQVCDKYAAAVKQSVPQPLPPGLPANFPDGLARTGEEDCVQQAARLGYGSPNLSIRRVAIGQARAAVLIHHLTDNTMVHVTL
jgi:hypothetical protein